jgi:hypothetical protein
LKDARLNQINLKITNKKRNRDAEWRMKEVRKDEKQAVSQVFAPPSHLHIYICPALATKITTTVSTKQQTTNLFIIIQIPERWL